MSIPKFLKFHGKDATLRNFSSTGTDSYGDTTKSSSTTSTQVVIDRNLTESNVDTTEIGQDARIDALIYIDSEETVEDGEDANLASEVDVDGKTYEVLVRDNLGNGVYQCLTKRV